MAGACDVLARGRFVDPIVSKRQTLNGRRRVSGGRFLCARYIGDLVCRVGRARFGAEDFAKHLYIVVSVIDLKSEDDDGSRLCDDLLTERSAAL